MVWFWRKKRGKTAGQLIHAELVYLLRAQGKLMSDLTKLQAAIAANTQAVAEMQAEIAALKAAAAAVAGEQASVDTLASQVETNNAALAALKTA